MDELAKKKRTENGCQFYQMDCCDGKEAVVCDNIVPMLFHTLEVYIRELHCVT